MDLSEEQADALFPESRDDKGMESVEDFHLGIDFGPRAHVVLYTDDEEFELSKPEKEQLLDDLDIGSIWDTIANKERTLEWLRNI